MPALKLLSRQDRLAIVVAAGAASLSVVSATLLVFAADGRTEWFAADSDLAVAARRCDKTTGDTQRHVCLREVADARRATNAAPTRPAQALTRPPRSPA